MRLVYILLLCFFPVLVYSQSHNGKIIYSFKNLKEKKILELNYDDSSSISVYDKIGFDTTYSGFKNAIFDSEKGLNIKVSSYDSLGQMVYRNLITKEIILRQTKIGLLDAFEVKDNWIEIKWKYYNSKKTILGYECLKATGHFRGRKYTAWYALNIKKPFGPWKLFGLPGIILEAYDEDKNFHFVAQNINISNEIVVAKPDELIKKTLDEYVYYLNNKPQIIHQKIQSMKLPSGVTIGDISYQTPNEIIRNERLERQFESEKPIIDSTKSSKNTFSISPSR